MASATVHSKVVVLLLLIHCLLLLQLFMLFVFGPCLYVQYLVSSLVLRSYFCWIELGALLQLSAWCLVTVSVLWLFLTSRCVGLQCVIVVFPAHSHFLYTVHIRLCPGHTHLVFSSFRQMDWEAVIWRIIRWPSVSYLGYECIVNDFFFKFSIHTLLMASNKFGSSDVRFWTWGMLFWSDRNDGAHLWYQNKLI